MVTGRAGPVPLPGPSEAAGAEVSQAACQDGQPDDALPGGRVPAGSSRSPRPVPSGRARARSRAADGALTARSPGTARRGSPLRLPGRATARTGSTDRTSMVTKPTVPMSHTYRSAGSALPGRNSNDGVSGSVDVNHARLPLLQSGPPCARAGQPGSSIRPCPGTTNRCRDSAMISTDGCLLALGFPRQLRLRCPGAFPGGQ